MPRQFMGVGGGMGGTNVRGRPVVVVVRGPVALDILSGAANQVIEKMHTVPGITDVDMSLPPPEPEMQIVVDRQRVAQNGVSAATVGSTIRTLVSGTTATQVDWNDQRVDVSVQLRDADLSDLLRSWTFRWPRLTGRFTRYAAWPPRAGTGPTVLERQDASARLPSEPTGRPFCRAVVPDVQTALNSLSLPPG